MYTTKHAQILYRVASSQTIRNWAKEFADYLSPTATPEKGGTRHFTLEDMKVFALIAEYSNENKSFTDIHVALQSGARGDAPTVEPEDLDGLAAGEIEMQLTSELDKTRALANELEAELASIKEKFEPIKEENIRLQAQLEDRDSRIEQLTKQIESAQERIQQLAEEKGQAYVKGVMDAMKNKGDFGNE